MLDQPHRNQYADCPFGLQKLARCDTPCGSGVSRQACSRPEPRQAGRKTALGRAMNNICFGAKQQPRCLAAMGREADMLFRWPEHLLSQSATLKRKHSGLSYNIRSLAECPVPQLHVLNYEAPLA